MKRLQVNITHITPCAETGTIRSLHTDTSVNLHEAVKIAVKHMKTDNLIERIAAFELEKNYTFPPSEIVRAFMETDCFPFSRPDVEFIKACLKSETLQTSKMAWKTYAAEKRTEAVKSELKIYHAIRNEIKNSLKGLIYYGMESGIRTEEGKQ